MDELTVRARVVAAAREWIGTPYHHMADVKRGLRLRDAAGARLLRPRPGRSIGDGGRHKAGAIVTMAEPLRLCPA